MIYGINMMILFLPSFRYFLSYRGLGFGGVKGDEIMRVIFFTLDFAGCLLV